MRIPAEADINVYNSLDEIYARDHFLNKTVEEAEELFRENSAYYQEDLMWMGPRAFAYYLQSAINYLKTPEAADEDDFLNSLYAIVRFRSEQEGFSVALDRVKELIDYVIHHYDRFKVNHAVYGDLLEKYSRLRELVNGQQ